MSSYSFIVFFLRTEFNLSATYDNYAWFALFKYDVKLVFYATNHFDVINIIKIAGIQDNVFLGADVYDNAF